jgi:choline-sulfatase
MQPANLLILCSDEHQRAVTGCYGNPVVRTPHIDGLARAGTTFENAYCNAPLCVPSRASFATGRYAHVVHSWCNATAYGGDHAQTWGHRLTEQGHHVTTIGKLHYRRAEDPIGFPDQRIAMHLKGGLGDVHGLLRERAPVTDAIRDHVLHAGPGDSDYLQYDRAIARHAAQWLRDEAPSHGRPWVLFVSFLSPHYPLTCPEPFYRMYPHDQVPMPIQWRAQEWPRHPALELFRRIRAHDRPFTETELRRAIATYYGMVSFVDDLIGNVLAALDASGQRGRTRILYTTDHGEHLGDHGLWWKRAMYESATAVPLILSGPDVPAGRRVRTNASLIDLFPTVVAGAGARFADVDADLPGRSLLDLATAPAASRSIFSEYHGAGSAAGSYMLRTDRFKYVHYCDGPPQLFDLVADPRETRDVAGDPAHRDVRDAHERALRAIADPDALDREAKIDQRRLIDLAGGEDAIRGKEMITYFPPPAV